MAQEIADSKLLDTWGSSGTKIEPDISKIIEGWQLGEQPPHEYMNWLQNTFGRKLNHILKNGIAEWNNETEYLAGSSVQHSGNVWLCETTNTNSEPTGLNANWEKIAINKDLTVTVDTLADLRNISYPANTVWASGYHTKNDGAFGSHIFRLKGVKTTETDNSGTIIIATIGGVDYVYELQYDGAVNVKWFGFISTNTSSDNAIALTSAGTAHKTIEISSGIYDCDDVVFPTQINIKGSGDSGQCVIRNQSGNPLFTFGSKFNIDMIYFQPQGISPETIRATTKTDISITNCVFNLESFVGIIGTDTFESRCINLYDCSNVKVNNNKFLNGWNDKTYDASTAAAGNNCLRMINIENYLQQNIEVSNNYFNEVWTAIYISNSSHVTIDNNTIIDTADTAIFERCTAGYSFHKRITNNKLKNIGKGGIKTLDTNNATATAYGRDSLVSGNIIENFGMKIATAAIFAACHYDGTYVYSATHRARDLVISGNILVETDANSCHDPITCTNIDNAVVTNNSITLLDSITDVWSSFAYSRFTFSNNVIKMQGRPSFSFPLKGIIKGNNIECYDYVDINNTESTSPEPNRFTILFDGNIVKTVDTTATRVTYGIKNTNNSGGYGNVVCTNNVFETALVYSDSNDVNSPHIANFPPSGNIIDYATIDNNTVIFTDRVATQKTIGGDILYPVYYSGFKGSIKTDETTGVITYKRNINRITVNTITPTT